MEREIWKSVPGLEGRYEVSNLGHVRSVDRIVESVNRWGTVTARPLKGRLIKPAEADEYGHQSVSLSRRTFRVHALVMLAFEGPTPEGLEIRHLDGDPRNNALSNLCFGTRAENNRDIARHNRRKLTVAEVHDVRERHSHGEPGYLIARDYTVCATSIYYVLSGRTYGHV